ncbi:MAG: FAD-dependent oxidoreductase [Flavobacteriaceae bacterium]|nr:FAD-dependent oxidoreductase [Flavobacteriaceae bacterium]
MNLSYWERNTWLHNIDYAIVGSGIVGLSCALALRQLKPASKIVVFERGMLPSGASTKNAGFACFGSMSEILSDLETHTEEEVLQLVQQRLSGLATLRNRIGDSFLNFQRLGGYEIFTENSTTLYEKCLESIPRINSLLNEVFLDQKPVFSIKKDPFGLKNVQKDLIFNCYEGQLDPGRMTEGLLQKVAEKGILLLNNAEITSFSAENDQISLVLDNSIEFRAKRLCIATNGFARQLLQEDVKPARAQVLVTHPIPDLKIKGTFHLDEGYYYFRNVNDRILLGGGRNLDFEAEETTENGLTERVQQRLEELLRYTILPDREVEIEQRWSGIMGVGAKKKPIVKELQPNVFCGVRLGGMGVAIGTSVGTEMAQLAIK